MDMKELSTLNNYSDFSINEGRNIIRQYIGGGNYITDWCDDVGYTYREYNGECINESVKQLCKGCIKNWNGMCKQEMGCRRLNRLSYKESVRGVV